MALATSLVGGRTWIDQTEVSRESAATAVWVDTYVPHDAVLLVHDAGVISELAHRRAVDLVGLKSPASVGAHLRSTWPSCGADRSIAVAAIARAAGASYVVVDASWDRAFGLVQGLSAQGFRLTLERPSPVSNGYVVYRLWQRPG